MRPSTIHPIQRTSNRVICEKLFTSRNCTPHDPLCPASVLCDICGRVLRIFPDSSLCLSLNQHQNTNRNWQNEGRKKQTLRRGCEMRMSNGVVFGDFGAQNKYFWTSLNIDTAFDTNKAGTTKLKDKTARQSWCGLFEWHFYRYFVHTWHWLRAATTTVYHGYLISRVRTLRLCRVAAIKDESRRTHFYFIDFIARFVLCFITSIDGRWAMGRSIYWTMAFYADKVTDEYFWKLFCGNISGPLRPNTCFLQLEHISLLAASISVLYWVGPVPVASPTHSPISICPFIQRCFSVVPTLQLRDEECN